MYRDILTMCWSIREVNRNLSDRRSTADYSIKYLKDACANLAGIIKQVDKSVPGEAIEVVDSKGKKRTFSLKEVADMLYDARKIRELNLIDNIDRWARVHIEWEEVKSRPVG
jgi:phosphoribosyl-ATP pyrophosphohydrolase